MAAMLEKHREFEERARVLQSQGAEWYKEANAHGVKQHVVKLERTILRWPVEYEGTKRKVRYEPLPNVCSAESERYAHYR